MLDLHLKDLPTEYQKALFSEVVLSSVFTTETSKKTVYLEASIFNVILRFCAF